LLCALAGLAQAEPDRVKWGAPLDCKSKELLATYPLPATLSKDAVLRELVGRPLTNSATKVEVTCVLGKPWKVQKQPTFIVFVDSESYYRSQNGEARRSRPPGTRSGRRTTAGARRRPSRRCR
jgi:hypothetical protein